MFSVIESHIILFGHLLLLLLLYSEPSGGVVTHSAWQLGL